MKYIKGAFYMNKIIAAFAAALIMTIAVNSYSDAVQSDLQNGLIRLHIIADGDDEEAQTVKLKVRDAVLAEMSEKFACKDIEMSRQTIEENLGTIEEIADRTLRENGFTYTSRVEYGKFAFPQKSYGNVTLPAGDYYGVRVILGSGGGRNWWCVMYPPMCFAENSAGEMDKESDKELRDNLCDETYDIITGSGGEIEVKFKIVELVHGVKKMIWK